MSKILAIVITLFLGSGHLTSQEERVQVRRNNGLALLEVHHAAIESMCQGLAARLKAPADALGVLFNPKQGTEGFVWEIRLSEKGASTDVPVSELPTFFRKLTGATASKIMDGSCFLKEDLYLSPQEIALRMKTLSGAVEVQRALSK